MSRSVKYLMVTLSALMVSLGVASPLTIRSLEPGSSHGAVHCRVMNLIGATTREQAFAIRRLGWAWLHHARVCAIGGFTVVVPAKQRSGKVIRIYRDRKPVFFATSASSSMYAPLVRDGGVDRRTVIEAHPHDGRVTGLTYNVWKGRSRVQVSDLNFDGTPDVRVVWRGFDIRKLDGWYDGHWAPIRRRKMLISGRWRPVHFSDGAWHIGRARAPDHRRRSSHAP